MKELLGPFQLPDILGLVALAIVVVSFVRMHRDSTTNFNVFDLVMERGRVSKLAVIALTAFVVYSWVIVRLTVDGRITEGYLTMYGVTWVAPIIAKLFSPERTE